MSGIITLTTDFGYRDAYVAAMKGVILSVCPEARIIDISHGISPHDVMEGAFVIRNSYTFFPEGTVHMAVIDPGVGTDRRAIALRIGTHIFVGPDNGTFDLVAHNASVEEIVELTNRNLWRTAHPADTFHGRDVFAPVAAHLAGGNPLTDVGTIVGDMKKLVWALPVADETGIRGWVVHIDSFGNCTTNIPGDHLVKKLSGRTAKCYIGTAILKGLYRTYGEVETGEPLMLCGSSNFIEIAVRDGSAAELLGIKRGAPVNLVFGKVDH